MEGVEEEGVEEEGVKEEGVEEEVLLCGSLRCIHMCTDFVLETHAVCHW